MVDGSPDVDAAEKVARAVGDGGLGPHGALEEDFVFRLDIIQKR